MIMRWFKMSSVFSLLLEIATRIHSLAISWLSLPKEILKLSRELSMSWRTVELRIWLLNSPNGRRFIKSANAFIITSPQKALLNRWLSSVQNCFNTSLVQLLSRSTANATRKSNSIAWLHLFSITLCTNDRFLWEISAKSMRTWLRSWSAIHTTISHPRLRQTTMTSLREPFVPSTPPSSTISSLPTEEREQSPNGSSLQYVTPTTVWDVPIWDSSPEWLFNLSLLPERSLGVGITPYLSII